jgi:hypothetical protein
MENIITKFKTIYLEVKSEKGPCNLFMVLKMDDFTDKWSLAISAKWITQENKKEIFKYVADKLTSRMSPAEISTIARLGIFLPDEHLVNLFNSAVAIQGNGEPIRLVNTKINGFQVHEAYIFESTRVLTNI